MGNPTSLSGRAATRPAAIPPKVLMSASRWSQLALLAICSGMPVAASMAAELVSVPAFAAPLPSSGESYGSAVSDDGRWVAFMTEADNLVAGDSNGFADVIRLDRQTGQRAIVSRSAAEPGNNLSFQRIDISNDGRYVVFLSRASNLVAGDSNGRSDLFRKDMSTGAIQRIAFLGSNDMPPELSLSGDGSVTVFVGAASDWIAGATGQQRLLRVDWAAPIVTEQLLATIDPVEENTARISSDGSCIAFRVLREGGSPRQVRVRRLSDGFEFFVDSAPTLPFGGPPNGSTEYFALDAQCQSIVFVSAADNLLPQPTPAWEVYRRDLTTANLTRVSTRAAVGGFMWSPSVLISPDGQRVLYEREHFDEAGNFVGRWFERRNLGDPAPVRDDILTSRAMFLGNTGQVVMDAFAPLPGDLNGWQDVHVSPGPGQASTLLSSPIALVTALAANGMSSHGYGPLRAGSKNGRLQAFESLATNLVANDPGGDAISDVYLRDRLSGQTERILGAGNVPANADVWLADISADGNFVLVRSCATNLLAADQNGQCDLFLADRNLTMMELVNVATDGSQANFESLYPEMAAVSDDGRFVVFQSRATNLVSTQVPQPQVYVRDRNLGTTRLLLDGAVPLDGDTRLQAFAAALPFAAVSTQASNALPGCSVIGVDLVSGSRECLGKDPQGATLDPVYGVSLSADGRFVSYNDSQDQTGRVLLLDRSLGRARHFPAADIAVAVDGAGMLSGNGRFISRSAFVDVNLYAGVFDTVLNEWAMPMQASSIWGGRYIDHDGSALTYTSGLVLDAADANGSVADIYRTELRGNGVFGGGWQGGFE